MTKKKSTSDILAQLLADDALAVLRILTRDEAIAPRIRQVAETYLERNAPHAPEDIEMIAEDVRTELENLDVEEVWDRAGQTRHGYVETAEAADEMMQFGETLVELGQLAMQFALVRFGQVLAQLPFDFLGWVWHPNPPLAESLD